MSLSAINCTSLRTNSPSFSRNGRSDDDEKKGVLKIAEKVLIVAGATAVGIGGTSYLSGRLLSKINNNAKFAHKIGDLAYAGYEKLIAKASKINVDELTENVASSKGAKKTIANIKLFSAKTFNRFVNGLPVIADGKGVSRLTIKNDTISNVLKETVYKASTEIEPFKNLSKDGATLSDMIQAVISNPEAFEKIDAPLVKIIKKVIADSSDKTLKGSELESKVVAEFTNNYKGQNFVKVGLSWMSGLAAGVAGLTNPDHDNKLSAEQALDNIVNAAVGLAVS